MQHLAQQGLGALQRGDFAAARAAFEQVTAAGASTPRLDLLLAHATFALKDMPATIVALDAVLAAEPRNIEALMLRGDAAAGDDRAASAYYNFALTSAAGTNPSPAIAARLAHARAQLDAANARMLAHLRATVAGSNAGPRFEEAVAIVAGVKQPYFQSPTSFFYPGLPHTQFFDPADFPWAAALEAQAPAIRAELEAVLASDTGLKPYVEADPNRPSRGHDLMGDPNWSAFHLWENGKPVPGNADRCPATMAALAGLPIPRIAGRSPMALFSVLEHGTHIAAHHGMINTRCIVHLPLIVPPACRLRVGNDTRAVEAGRLMIFDDSIEHEAWNDSAATRVVLLFEVWRPELSGGERDALTQLFEAIGSYG
ncbi:aspartyl/asparaginyl beta-hydroxylase domain-containing protein [Sphingomonas antarctica]|uniref:aspartyl/asparaginyl beta-hydroxylase domain-containing protein n=1 Tax=Sphingomonas antarctica TaxID=2040274 RepID=UPI0039E9036D